MAALRDIKGEALVQWAERIDAPAMLPALVRRLLLASAPLQSISMPADSGVRLEGWDGILSSTRAGPFWPAGPSVWELSVAERVRRKLDEDFTKRTQQASSPSIDASRTTYVAVTARRLGQPEKEAWVTEKRRQGIWADVRVYDADDLAAWLAQTPAVACWFATSALEQPAAELTDVEDFLHRWSGRGRTHPLPPELVVAGRERQKAAQLVRAWLGGARPQPLHVRGETREEALLFVAASLTTSPRTEREQWLARALVVESREAWRWAVRAHQAQPLVLLPGFEDFDPGEAVTSNAFVVVPEDATASGRPHVLLEPIPFKSFAEVLVQAGVREADAERLAREAGGKVSAYQTLAGYRALSRPGREDEAALLVMLLAGAWTPSNEADQEALRWLGADPKEVEQLCAARSREPGRPIVADTERWGRKSWRWASSAEAWKRLAGKLTDTQLQTFVDVALAVLGEPDPQYDMPKEERVYAAIQDKALRHSSALREGLAESIVRLSLSDEELKAIHGVSLGSRSAEIIVQQLLVPNWKRWASLSEVLPTLAEAAPRAFLNAIERSLDQGELGVAHLLVEEWGLMGGNSPHTGLLWALETLGWSAELMPRVANALARLAERDPGGRLANRPLASLIQLLRAVHAQTSAPIEQQHEVLGHLMERRPAIGWSVALSVVKGLQGPSLVLDPSRRPHHLPPPPPDPDEVSHEHLRKQFDTYFDLLMRNAGQDADKWADLIELTPWLPGEILIGRVLNGVSAVHGSLGDAGVKLWAGLRGALGTMYSRAPEDRHDTTIERVLNLYKELSPTDPVARISWLFMRGPVLPEPERDDWRAQEQRIHELRSQALAELWSHHERWELIGRLADATDAPEIPGYILGEAGFAEEFEKRLLQQEPEQPTCSRMVPAFVAGRFASRQSDTKWLEQTLRTLLLQGRQGEAAQAATLIKPGQSLWRLLEQLGDPLRLTYWQTVSNIYVDSAEEWETAIRNLLEHGRELAALDAASRARKEVSTETLLEVLEQLSTSISTHKQAPEGVGQLRGHALEQLFKSLDLDTSIDAQRIMALEVFFFPWLQNTGRKASRLYEAIEKEPALFTDLVSMQYRRKQPGAQESPESPETVDESAVARAHAIFKIMEAWKGVPGTGLPDAEERLFDWATQSLELTRTRGYESGGIVEVAKVLARAGAASDGVWPCMTARKLLERDGSERLARNIRTARRNLRGAHWRSGGEQERAIADGYKRDADKLRTGWPKTAALLDELADAYLHDAEEEEAETRSERIKYGWEPESEEGASTQPATASGEPPPAEAMQTPIERLELRGIASAPNARLELAPRLNLLAGDNSTGKTLVLDVLWWAQTGTWTGAEAWPGPAKEGRARAAILVGTKENPDVESHFDAVREQWVRPPQWPTSHPLALYARADGGFSVWDPIRNAVPSDNGRADALSMYRFTPDTLWNGLDEHGTTWCNGLVRDWVDWQYRRTGLFDSLKEVLAGLSLPDEPLRPGSPTRISIHQALDIPTLEMSYGTVPVIHASAAVRRVLGLAYLLVWSWNEHREAARLAGQPVSHRLLLFIDEVESHLHPKWQRLFLPALLRVIQRLTGEVQVQVVASTHSPLVMASLERHFDTERDKVFHFGLKQGRIVVEEQPWAMQGDAVNWLVSETFGLKQARSQEAEQAIEAAEAYMRNETLPGYESPEKLNQKLQETLPGNDPFWPRWLVAIGAVR
ncbi:AAA family ATPase [Archangium violaceum]|uniref:AAA family ATPase n=1 Tax=Archangium violaceum TaxID=83451 RepID=UPI0036DDAD0A